MKTQTIANTDLTVSRIAYGCMTIGTKGGSWAPGPVSAETQRGAVAAVRAALDAGINFFDHADIYGSGKSEQAFAQIWSEQPGLRPQIYVQSKCGIRFRDDPRPGAPARYDFSYEHIVRAAEGSLRRLGTDYLDVLLLHRPDPLVQPEEVARAFDVLHQAGKVRYFGVSNHTAAQIELLRRYVRQPLVINQLELNLLHAQLIDAGIVFNQENPLLPVRGDGTLEYCRLHDITIQTWGSLANGALTGRQMETNDERLRHAAAAVAAAAHEHRVSGEAILVAWLLRHPAHLQPIIGTTQPERIRAACQGDGIELSREEWYTLFVAGRGAGMP